MLEVSNVSKQYVTPAGPVHVLAGVALSVNRGSAIAVMGPSGSGKSTLLYLLGALEPPSSGTVTLDAQDPFLLGEQAQAAFRNEKVGFVFQDHCLLPQCSVLENVLVPTLVAPPGDHRTRAVELLDRVGLSHRLSHLPGELSGGEKQRVAIARALIRDPLLLLCDEPTGNLDRESAGGVTSMLLKLHRDRGNILIVVTHSLELASQMPVVYEIAGGRLQRREVPHPPGA